jgi:hypothetical protein
MKTGRSSSTRIIRIVDRDAVHPELIKDTLAAGGVAIAVAGDAGLHVVVCDLGIEHRLDTRFVPELRILACSTRLDELRQANAQDVRGSVAFAHFDDCSMLMGLIDDSTIGQQVQLKKYLFRNIATTEAAPRTLPGRAEAGLQPCERLFIRQTAEVKYKDDDFSSSVRLC